MQVISLVFSHRLDFADCTIMVHIDKLLCPLHYLQIGRWIEELDQSWVQFFSKDYR